MMNDWQLLFREVADPHTEPEFDVGEVLFSRRDEEHHVSLLDVKGTGLCVETKSKSLMHVETYVQRELFGLPRLAQQIARVLQDRGKTRPVSFIEGPSTVLRNFDDGQQYEDSSPHVIEFLTESVPGATQILQLMAGAGQGKTVLLEQVALRFALDYQPDPNPKPLVVPVDLLGRYVGNIDDAIAGTLNNSFLFPHLTQRDVVLAMRYGWLALALDGFDELVARVGSRDAFNRINDLLDQLEGRGTLILSARSNFFELFEVSSAMRTYLKPRHGAYVSAVMQLDKWTDKQGEEVFGSLGHPVEDFHEIKRLFDGDEDVVHQPFLLTRLANAWKGSPADLFDDGIGETKQARMDAVVRAFLRREAEEKWVDRNQLPLIDISLHYKMLGGIACEMWRAQSFTLDREELGLGVEFALDGAVQMDVLDDVRSRVPTHAALTLRGGRCAFLNDQFLYLFLGWSLADAIVSGDKGLLRTLLEPNELSPSALAWFVTYMKLKEVQPGDAIAALVGCCGDCEGTDIQARLNLGSLLGAILRTASAQDVMGLHIRSAAFLGEALRDVSLRDTEFEACAFWDCDLSGSRFLDCTFVACEFGRIRLESTADTFVGTKVDRCVFSHFAVEENGVYTAYSPDEAPSALGVTSPNEVGNDSTSADRTAVLDPDVARVVEKVVAISMRRSEFTREDLLRVSHVAEEVVDRILSLAVETKVLSEKQKATSGPKRTFFKFEIDRNELLLVRGNTIKNQATREFWQRLQR